MPKNIIELTDGQLEYLQDLVMFAYEMEVPEQKGWDIQTFDNLVDAVCSPTGQPLNGQDNLKSVTRELQQFPFFVYNRYIEADLIKVVLKQSKSNPFF